MHPNEIKFVYERFEEQVKTKSDHIALEYGTKQMTYRQVQRCAHTIHLKLVEKGFHAGDIAALEFQSPLAMTVAVMAVLKTGGAYLPMRPDAPAQYTQDILRDSRVNVYITAGNSSKNIQFQGEILVCDPWQYHQEDPGEPAIKNHLHNPFTIIYESNSTGKAEGISLSHEKIIKWLQFNLEKLRVDFTRTLFVTDSMMMNSFPLWLGNLITGGSVSFYNPGAPRTLTRLSDLMAQKKITSIVCPLSFMQTLAHPDNCTQFLAANIKNIISVGEQTLPFNVPEFKEKLKNRSRPVKWHNYYGFPQIQMITSLVADELSGKKDYTHIGKPASQTRAYVLNKSLQLVSIGKTGCLYLAGSGIMDTYIHNDHLNRLCFVDSAHLPDPVIFKTAYNAYWLADGKLSMLGRSDSLLNINGNRVAPGEVEAALFRHPLINDCAVTTKKTDGEQLRLTAYLVPGGDVSDESLDEFLKNSLPAEYFPIGFSRLHVLPRTPAGQVDRKYLEQLGHFDSLQVRTLEKRIREFPQIEDAAVVVEEKTGPPVPLYLKDYLPDLRPLAANESGEAAETVEQPVQELEHSESEPAIIHGAELAWEEDDPRTLADALKRAAAQHGDHGTYFIQADGSSHFQTYRSLLEEAEQVLAGLKKIGLKPHDKALFLFNRNEDFVSAFWGCMLAGVVPVPLMVPKSFAATSNEIQTLTRVWELLDKPVILSDRQLEPMINSLLKQCRVGTIESLRDNGPDSHWHKSDPEDVVIILFTSGSTGVPKGVLQCHRSILAREKSTTLFNDGSCDDVSINWMPLEHVGGVVMFHLNDVFMGCMQIQVSTQYILTDPLRWLDIISQYKGTITWAPNFAYTLVSEQLGKRLDGDWDLSHLRFILNAGEAINAASTRKFLELLAPYGLSPNAMKPAWGMSETCSAVVYSHLFTTRSNQGILNLDKVALGAGFVKQKEDAQDPNTGTFVQLGKTIPGTSIRIVDAANKVVPEGVTGRLQIKGPAVTSGYYKNPQLNEEVFTHDGWFDTGDLAFILDQSMTLSGRAKDVIIINGINFSSMEIEAVVEEVEGVETSFTAACSLREENSDTDKIIIFYNSAYSDFYQVLDQVKQVTKRFAETFGMNLDYIVPVTKVDIPKTSIGKIQRKKLVKRFQEGAFDDILRQVDIGLENENTLPPWFFKKLWRNHSIRLYDKPTSDSHRYCLLFEDGPGLSHHLEKRLAGEKGRCINVTFGSEFKLLDPLHYQIDPLKAGDYDRLIEAVEDKNDRIHDIFFFAPAAPFNDLTVDYNVDAQKDIHQRGLYSLLYLIQTLERKSHHVDRLFVVSANELPVLPDDPVDYGNAAISGFLKSVSLELEWLHCCHVDLDIKPEPDNAEKEFYVDHLVREWKMSTNVSQVAYRNDARLTPYLSPLDLEKEERQDVPIGQKGIYMVTGGLGGIGTLVCKWLINHCAAKLLIIGRTTLPDREQWPAVLQEKTLVAKRIRAYLELEATGGQFIYIPGDIADETLLSQAIARAQSQWQDSLAGVFHIAGYLSKGGNLKHHWQEMDRHWVAKESPQTFEQVFKAKVYGTLALHRAIKDHKEAIFVGFSSTAAFFGSPGFSAYSAANSFLDHFCLYRQANGWADTYCLNYSSWENVGMSEDNPEPMLHTMLANGYNVLLPQQGMQSMLIALGLKPQQHFIGLNSVNPHIRSFMAEAPSLTQLANVYYTSRNKTEIDEPALRHSISQMISSPDKNSRAVLKMHRIDEMPLTDRNLIDYRLLREMDDHLREVTFEGELPQTGTEQKLAQIWREILAKTHIGVNDNFFELGGHSLKATTLVSRIHKVFDVKIPQGDVFRIPTIKEIACYIDNNRAGRDRYASIEPVEKKEYYALSSAQERLYILYQLEPRSTAYNIFQYIPLLDKINLENLEKVFIKLLDRHESLRTSFRIIADEPVQWVHDQVDFKIRYHELDPKKAGNLEDALYRFFVRPFDLSFAPLLRVGVVKTGASQQLLLLDMHHIITDATSQYTLEKEFMTLQADFETELTPLRLQYKDFSEWQSREEQKESLKQQESYWLELFSDNIPVIDLPIDFPRPLMQSFEGNRVNFVLAEEETQTLKGFAKETDATLYMILLSAFTILLSRLSGQEGIIVGTPIAARRHADLECIIGMFVNTLAMRNQPSVDKSLNEFLFEVKEHTLKALENQEYQFEDLVDKLPVQRDTSRNPLFDVMFNLLNKPDHSEDVREAGEQDQYVHHIGTSIFDLNLTATEMGKRIIFDLEYSTALFKSNTIERIIGYFKKILLWVSLSVNKQRKLSDLEILSGEEKKLLLDEFNDTAAGYPQDKTIHRLFEEQAAKTPDNIAVIGRSAVRGEYDAGPGRTPCLMNHALTYRELDETSALLAGLLIKKGVKAGKIVGIKTVRSIEMVIAIMAVLKAGAAYLPIDPDYPEARTNYIMVESSGVMVLDNLFEVTELCMGKRSASHGESGPLSLTWEDQDPTSLAYVIYTSGSTGTPRGVAVEHRSVVNIIDALFKLYPFYQADTYLLKTPCVFDVSVSELFGWFPGGGRLAVLEPGAEKDPLEITAAIKRLQVSHINFVPSMFSAFVDWLSLQPSGQLASLKYIFLAGEALSTSVVNKFRALAKTNKIRLENIYGPTEGTVYAAYYSLPGGTGIASIPIGKPLQNVKLYILNAYHHLHPVGVTGELCIAGTGVARGYLNNPELTEEKFVPSPFTHRPPPLYKTGDLARWLPDGNIEFLGRKDHQIKIRGFRIELGEIENRLLGNPGIKETVVTLEGETDVDKYLCAYIVRTGTTGEEFTPAGPSSNADELRTYLSQSLPDYMVPAYFVELGKIPLTPSGKIDRKALPAPDIIPGSASMVPRDELEKRVAAIWSEVLFGRDTSHVNIDINANFFKLGGHSLKATILASKLHKVLSVNVPLSRIFKSPTVRGLSEYIKEIAGIKYKFIDAAEKKEYYVLSSAQKRVYSQQNLEPEQTFYNMTQIVAIEGKLDPGKVETTFKELINRHEGLRTSFELVEGDPVQRVYDDVEFSIRCFDQPSINRNPATDRIDEIIGQFVCPFDLSKAPLMRVGIINVEEKKRILMVDMHHIISDGASLEIAVNDFTALYDGQEFPQLRIHYKDYSEWQNTEETKAAMKQSEAYWLQELAGDLPVLNLPLDFERPAVHGTDGDEIYFELSREVTGKLEMLAQSEQVTLFMMMLAIYNVLLARITRQQDILVGSVAAGRNYADLDQVIGMFVNNLVLRNYPNKEKTFSEFLREVKERTLAAFDHQDYQFEELVKTVATKRDLSRFPMYDAGFVLHDFMGRPGETQTHDKPETVLKTYPYEKKTSIAEDLYLEGYLKEETLCFNFRYCTALFKKETVENLTTFFCNIAAAVCENPGLEIKEIGIISQQERSKISVAISKDRDDLQVEFDI